MKKNLEGVLGETIEAILSSEIIVLTSHRNADPDAVAPLFYLKSLLEKVFSRKTFIVLPEGLNEVSKKILYSIGLDNVFDHLLLYRTSIPSSYKTLYIVVDTSNSVQLGVVKDYVLSSKYIVLDHHREGDLGNRAYTGLIDPSYTSTSELVYTLFKELYRPSMDEALLLITGILYDTRRLLLASKKTIDTIKELTDICSSCYQEAIELLRVEPSYSEKIARLKAMQRLEFIRIDKYIVAYTYVGAYESSIARLLIELGADIAFVGSSRKDVVRIVGRARKNVLDELGVSLARDVMPRIASCLLEGYGGGHDAAAVVTGRGDLLYALSCCISVVRDIISSRAKRE